MSDYPTIGDVMRIALGPADLESLRYLRACVEERQRAAERTVMSIGRYDSYGKGAQAQAVLAKCNAALALIDRLMRGDHG